MLRDSLRYAFSAMVFFAVALVAACGGAGTNAVMPVQALQTVAPTRGDAVAFSVKIPTPPPNASRRRNFVSSQTQSLGVVVTDQGFTPSPAQYANVASCPQVNGVTTCTLTVQALPGSDTFAVSAYSGQNGTGTVLSSGSITAIIPSSGPVPALTVTLFGEIARIVVTAVDSIVPIGQPALLDVAAEDSSGATVVGTFDNPIALTATNLTLSTSSLANSTAASSVTGTWTSGFTGSSNGSVTASADGVTGSLTISPASGFAYYTTGTNQTTDVHGFKMVLGADGNLYYDSIGNLTCIANFCGASAGGLHQFNPTSLTDTEIPVATEPEGLTYASDGSVWFAGGASPAPSVSPLLYRIPSGNFTASSLTSITMPGTNAGTTPVIRDVAQDTLGNIWIADLGSFRFLSVPVAGPYTTAAVTVYPEPTSIPAGVPFANAAITVNAAGSSIVYGAQTGYVAVVNPANGTASGFYATSLQTQLGTGTWSGLRDAASDGTTIYYGETGDVTAAYPPGALESFNPGTSTFTVLGSVNGPQGAEPVIPSISGTLLYYGDLYNQGLGVTNLSTGLSRLYPIASSANFGFSVPDGVAALPDGTAWFTCYGNQSSASYAPICIGHTLYLSNWGLWPGSSIALGGVGAAGAQIVGIMEAPTANSGPFTTNSSDTGVCAASTPADHNFTITGVAAGACSITVTDAHGSSQVIDVTVTTTTGTVQSKHREKVVRP